MYYCKLKNGQLNKANIHRHRLGREPGAYRKIPWNVGKLPCGSLKINLWGRPTVVCFRNPSLATVGITNFEICFISRKWKMAQFAMQVIYKRLLKACCGYFNVLDGGISRALSFAILATPRLNTEEAVRSFWLQNGPHLHYARRCRLRHTLSY